MSQSSSKILQGLLRFHYQPNLHTFRLKPFCSSGTAFSTLSSPVKNSYSGTSIGYSDSLILRLPFLSKLRFDPLSMRTTTSSNVGLSQPSQRAYISLLSNAASAKHASQQLSCQCLAFVRPKGYLSGVRHFSWRGKDVRKVNGKFANTFFERPAAAATDAFARYREAIGLQIEGFWKRNYLFLLGAGGVVMCALLWRIMFGIANMFVGLSEGMAKYGFLALSSAMVAFAGLYIRSRLTINPDKVYRMAMRQLNTSAKVLEVMGAPLTGTDLRAYVMSGGGLTLKTFKPSLRSKRCFLIFPIRGSERKGLVSVGVKKKRGQYDIKLLAVDTPMTSGPEERFYLIGDEKEYKVGGGLISELRDPLVKAMSATKEFDALDKVEEEEDAARELEEAERKHREEIEKLERSDQK